MTKMRKSELCPWRVWGKSLVAFQQGDQDAVVHSVREDGFAQIVPARVLFAGNEEFDDVDRTTLAMCGHTVLDVGAGAGRHSLELQSHGHDVCAMDLAVECVDVMHARGVRRVEQGSLETARLGDFDSILMLMNGIGLVQSCSGLDSFLRRLSKELRPRANVVFDSSDPGAIGLHAGLAGQNHVPACVETSYRFEFNGFHSRRAPWVFVDSVEIARRAEAAGLYCQIIARSEFGRYAAVLTIP